MTPSYVDRFSKLLLGALTLLFVGSCAPDLPNVQRTSIVDEVELSDILSNPKRFDHAAIRVKGLARIEFEANSLWADREAFEKREWKRAIWLNLGWPVKPDVAQLAGREVVVEGTFDASATGHMDAFAGTITNITRLEPIVK